MSSRFEQRRSRTGDAPPVIALVPPTRNGSREQTDDTEKERPWQTLLRKLRNLIAVNDLPSGTTESQESKEKPVLRVLPGGRLDEPEDQRRKRTVTRGKWH